MKLRHASDQDEAAYCARRIEALNRRLDELPAYTPASVRRRLELERAALLRRQAELQTRRLL